jgi:signal transduction histidine kinase
MSCCQYRIAGEGGIQFYGKMSASISHEIKNVLAIVNENAGLLEDLTMLAGRGTAVELERLQKISRAIAGQVHRADTIIRNMNRFAHSTDEPVKTVNLQELLDLVLALSSRLAANRGITLQQVSAAEPTSVTTAPFALQNLIWLCLDFAMNYAGPGKTVRLAVKVSPDRTGIEISQLKGLAAEHPSSIFPGEREKALLDILEADLELNLENGHLEIILPKNLSA